VKEGGGIQRGEERRTTLTVTAGAISDLTQARRVLILTHGVRRRRKEEGV
jgi:hypothetical protein